MRLYTLLVMMHYNAALMSLMMSLMMVHCKSAVVIVISGVIDVFGTHTTGVADSSLRLLQGRHPPWIPPSCRPHPLPPLPTCPTRLVGTCGALFSPTQLASETVGTGPGPPVHLSGPTADWRDGQDSDLLVGSILQPPGLPQRCATGEHQSICQSAT